MSATRFGSVLAEAAAEGRAVGAFTCYDLLGFEAVVRAAQARAAPVIVLVGTGSFAARGGERLIAAFRAAAAQARVPVLIQLDHAADRELIERAAAAGVDAVMADGSLMPYEQNLAFSAAVAQELRPLGIAVEAELGRVEGDEDLAAQTAGGALTDPDEAAAFVRSSGVELPGGQHRQRPRPLHGHSRARLGAARAAPRRGRAAGAARGVRAAGRRPAPGGVAGDRQGQRQHRAARGLLRRAGRRASRRGRRRSTCEDWAKR